MQKARDCIAAAGDQTAAKKQERLKRIEQQQKGLEKEKQQLQSAETKP